MALLTAQTSSDGPRTGWPLGDTLVPAGQHVAICLDVKDSLDIERPTFDDPSITETVDLTRFLFGLPDGSMIQTGEMKISGHEKSNLVKFLTGWLGKPPQMDGTWDYCEMKGQGAMINVQHRVSRKGRTYADIQGIAGVMEQLAAQIPNVSQFAVPESSPPPSQPAAQPTAQAVPQPSPEALPAPATQPATADVQPKNIFTPVQSDPGF